MKRGGMHAKDTAQDSVEFPQRNRKTALNRLTITSANRGKYDFNLIVYTQLSNDQRV